MFDPQAADYEKFAWARGDLRRLLGDQAYAAAERTTLNAHYTDAAYVQAIWQAVGALGFREGRVLEPGCGAGNFIAFAPEGAQMVGVELDPTTAAIAGALHTSADVRAESFADSRFREGSFDLVVGNVPFGDVVLHDPRHNGNSHRIHNHFLIKSLHLTRPGGLMAVITSRYTMDAANPAARREMAELADLVGAVRLPTAAHRRAAGTDVVTDVLVFRRRDAGETPRGEGFERALSQAVGQTELRINEYFVSHPEHVLGAMTVTQADRGRTELGVIGDRNAGDALAAALHDIAARALQRDLGLSPREATADAPVARVGASTTRPDRYLEAHPNQTFTRIEDGQRVPFSPPTTQAAELRALLALRDVEVALLEAEARSNDDGPALDALRGELNNRYDEYARTYGALNRFSTRRTGRLDPETGEERLAQIRPPQGGFRQDPYASAVYALEHFDANTQTATKATIFRERVVARRTPRLGADRPEDALAICLDLHGEARIAEVARLLGTDAISARSLLDTLVFDEPRTHRLVPAAEYLSGNIRTKLVEAQHALIEDARFAANVSALTEVLPRDLGPAEIRATLGAAWIAPHYVQEFLREILDDPALLVEHPGGSIWAVQGRSNTSVATTRWGTEKCDAVHLAQLLLEQRPVRIYDTDAEGKSVPNPTATLAAQEKAAEMAERFGEWVWEEPERAAALARVYNDSFNAIRPRTYDGSYLTLPGLALSFKPRPHQLDAVARIIAEPAVGLFHEVGAGKTADMVIGAMELRRLGLVQKPIVVVPNHMLEQFAREWLQLYPQAKLLAASKDDLDRDKRRVFVARCATNDWDAVVMVRTAFERVPMSLEVQRAYLEREVEAIAEMVAASKRGKGLTTKRLQGMKLRAEERLKRKLDGDKDAGITFEHLGADYLFVDEAHAYKNLATTSNIPGMSIEGSQRAQDLHLKLEHLRTAHGRTATLATATPVSNSMAEVYTMLRYLRPDLLLAAGLTSHDTWAATFARSVADVEVAPDGSGMRTQTRLKWHNLPELMRQWLLVGDVKTAEDLKLPVPAIAQRASDGMRAPETVIVPPSSELKELVAHLALRAERLRGRRPDQQADNMLSVTNDGRAAALDLRLLHGDTAEPQKVDVAAERIASIYQQAREHTYNGADGTPHPVRGALQIVFCDLGTPKTTRWHVYGELRDRLLARGLPRDAVRFVHEAKNDRDKADLFAACRDGRIAVLIGSTERMGVGTNIQRRALALHHLDAPWRPSDIAQREGRILRQGNENPEVQILRYVTERSFDSYTWQTITRKADDFGKLMRGQLDVREMDDICEAALSYNEVKALATGNPLLLEQAKTKAEVQRLERLGRAHERNQDVLRLKVRSNAAHIQELQSQLAVAEAAITRLLPLDARPRDLRVGSTAYEKS
ncbi:MAG TPA: methyltransferase domain-containing protein, partial [Polyangiales bacterium]|nr:methyltransferase domain-containing protein [Polyangiales bacterium]